MRKRWLFPLTVLLIQLAIFGILFVLGAANNWFGIWPIAWSFVAWFASITYANSAMTYEAVSRAGI